MLLFAAVMTVTRQAACRHGSGITCARSLLLIAAVPLSARSRRFSPRPAITLWRCASALILFAPADPPEEDRGAGDRSGAYLRRPERIRTNYILCHITSLI